MPFWRKQKKSTFVFHLWLDIGPQRIGGRKTHRILPSDCKGMKLYHTPLASHKNKLIIFHLLAVILFIKKIKYNIQSLNEILFVCIKVN